MKKLLLIIMLLFYIVSLNAQSINNEIELFFDEQFTEQVDDNIKITESEYSTHKLLATI